mmetsp:Transcript_72/g.198  ORF Transcript_72/g.198 Transcript_72/m.198 type:complete len:437 (-) Transcript_72:6-1316(-)
MPGLDDMAVPQDTTLRQSLPGKSLFVPVEEQVPLEERSLDSSSHLLRNHADFHGQDSANSTAAAAIVSQTLEKAISVLQAASGPGCDRRTASMSSAAWALSAVDRDESYSLDGTSTLMLSQAYATASTNLALEPGATHAPALTETVRACASTAAPAAAARSAVRSSGARAGQPTAIAEIGGSAQVMVESSLESMRAALVRETLEEALAGSIDQATMRLEPDDFSEDMAEDVCNLALTSPIGATSRRQLGRRPAPLTEDFYDDESDVEPCPDNCRASCASSKLLSNVSPLMASFENGSLAHTAADSLAYSCSPMPSNISTLKSSAGMTCREEPGHTLRSMSPPVEMGTEEALKSALCEVRTPTPEQVNGSEPASAANSQRAAAESAAGGVSPAAVVDRGRLEAFASAVRGADGLDKDLQKDLLSLLQSMPVKSLATQ